MQWRTFSIGWILALAVILFAQRRPAEPHAFFFRQVVDLTHQGPLAVSGDHLAAAAFGTRMDAPIHQENGQWAAEAVTPDRLVAPLIVMDLRERAAQDANYEITLDDVARWESQHGHVPPGAVVVAWTGWQPPLELPKRSLPHPAFSRDAVEFLVRARVVYGIGSDAPAVDLANATEMPVRRYLGENHVYSLANVAHLDAAPVAGGVIVVGPVMIRNAAGAPVRLLALLR
jgi:kynurenine formamidase